MKKVFYQENAYLLATVLISFGVALSAAADFGMSMVVAPAYIVSLRFPVLSFGQAEYVVQALVFILLCVLLGGMKPLYLVSFGSCLLYGFVLDTVRLFIPLFNSTLCPPGNFPFWLRALMFAVGMLITAASIALYVRSYIYCQVYDYFVKAVSARYGIPFGKFKTGYDVTSLLLAVALSLLFFRRLNGVGAGTVITAVCNGAIIERIGAWLDGKYDFRPKFPRLAAHFEN